MKCLSIVCVCFCIANLFVDAMHNGEYQPITDLPYMAQIIVYEYYVCSAVILSDVWIISAAHCASFVQTDRSTRIITGTSVRSSGGTLRNISQIFVASDYADETFSSDIGLFKLTTPIEFDEYQQPIQIARRFAPKVGDVVSVAGYGIHHHSLPGASLRSAQVPIIEHKVCGDYLKKFYNSSLLDNMFCTSTKKVELCGGDSGGPAVFNDQLIGIVSFGCDESRQAPNGFTKLADYYDWIMRVTGINYDN